MQIIKCVIRGQKLNIAIPTMVDLTINYFNVQASFSPEWDGMGIFCHIFRTDDNTVGGDFAVINGEVSATEGINLNTGEWNIWFSGTLEEDGEVTQRLTTETRKFNVLTTGTEDWSMPEIETSVAEQIMAVAQAALDTAEDVEERANNGEFDGEKGDTGPYFTPSVSENGVISWTNNGGLPNPPSRNITGPQGTQGPAGIISHISATVGENSGTPSVQIEMLPQSTPSDVQFRLIFDGLKGEPGSGGGGSDYPPVGGVPYDALSSDVQDMLDRGNSALQEVPNTYRTAAQQDVIDNTQNTKINKLAQVYGSTELTGDTVTFEAFSTELPLNTVIANIGPLQSGSGDPSGDNIRQIQGFTGCTVVYTGKNLAEFVDGRGINSAGNSVNVNGRCGTINPIKIDPTKTYIASHQGDSNYYHFIYAVWNGNTLVRRVTNVSSGTVLDTTNGERFLICAYGDSGYIANVDELQPMVEIGESASAYAQFKGKYQEISWANIAGTVYYGTLNVLTGVLKSKPYYSSYNGEELVGPWISDRDVYSPNTTPTIGAQVVDIGGADTVYQLMPVSIETVKGYTNIWTTSGTVYVSYGSYISATKEYCDNSMLKLMLQIAPVETGSKCQNSNGYTVGKYFILNGIFCKAKTTIQNGATFTLGTNYEETTLAAEIYAALQ